MNAGLPANPGTRKAFVLTAIVVAAAALVWFVKNHVSLDSLVLHEERIRAAIALNPWRSFAIGFGVYTTLSLIPGTGGKAIVIGWLYGYWQAMAIVMVGLTAAAMVIFSLCEAPCPLTFSPLSHLPIKPVGVEAKYSI